jgi:hypothetical protein
MMPDEDRHVETQKASPFAAIRFSSWDDLYGFSRKLENWFYREKREGQANNRSNVRW